MSSPSEPPPSWLVMPQESEMMSMPCSDSSAPAHASSLWSMIHQAVHGRFVEFLCDEVILEGPGADVCADTHIDER